MNQFEMVAMIVAVVMIASIIKTAIRARHGVTMDRKGNEIAVRTDPDADRLREEVVTLKERIAVLERLATDSNSSAVNLDREIEKLR